MLSHKSAALQQMPTIQMSVLLNSLNYTRHNFMVCWSTFQMKSLVSIYFRIIWKISLRRQCLNTRYSVIIVEYVYHIITFVLNSSFTLMMQLLKYRVKWFVGSMGQSNVLLQPLYSCMQYSSLSFFALLVFAYCKFTKTFIQKGIKIFGYISFTSLKIQIEFKICFIIQ